MSKSISSKLSRNKMKPEEIKAILKFQMRQLIEHGPALAMKPLFIEGYHGQGKTSVLTQVADELTEELRADKTLKADEFVYCLITNLTAKESTDFTGLPTNYEDKNELGEVKIYSTFGHPKDLPDKGYGILFLDEANRVQDRDMKSTLLSLLNDRMVNDNKLGDRWIMALAGNPFDDDRYEVGEFDSALADRVNRVFFESNHDIVFNYLRANEKYKGHFMLDFLAETPNFIDFSGGDMSPRRFERSMIDTLMFKDNYDQHKELVSTLLRVGLGNSASKQVIQFINDVKIPKVDDILKNKSITAGLVRKLRKENAQINALNQGLFVRLLDMAEAKKKLTTTQAAGLINYLDAISPENKLAFSSRLFDESNDLNQMIVECVLKWKAPKDMPKEEKEELNQRLKDLKKTFLKVYNETKTTVKGD